jgi:peptidoglycan/LPS O-acetylase OafA/YrhL
MFFVMSGMFVYKSAERSLDETGSFVQYFRNRYLRIAPAMYLYVVVVTLVTGVVVLLRHAAVFERSYYVWLLSNAALVPGYECTAFQRFGSGVLNGSLWTIPAEISFYVVVPLLVLLARRVGLSHAMYWIAPIALIGPFCAKYSDPMLQNILHHSFMEFAPCFVSGIVYSKYWRRIPKGSWLFCIILSLYVIAEVRLLPSGVLHPFVAAGLLGYCVVWFGYRGPRMFRRVTDRLGDLSFGTYIWHMPIINAAIWSGLNLGVFTVPCILLLSLIAARGSWSLVEQRALSRKREGEGAAAGVRLLMYEPKTVSAEVNP